MRVNRMVAVRSARSGSPRPGARIHFVEIPGVAPARAPPPQRSPHGIKVIDENRSPIECVVSLSAEETAVLARGAWIRMARLLKTDDEHVREKVDAMFTRREKAQAVAGIVMANAAHQAFDTLGVTFLLTPQFVVPDEWDEEQAITFTTRAFPVPDMELDLESPIAVGEDETPEEAARGALRQRLHGTMPQALLDEATKERREEFRGELASKGQTYREYRIEHGVKPAEVEERLEAEARKALEEDIALDLAFMLKGLEATENDEFAALSRLKPGSEIELKREFLETGHACLLRQEARRGAAVRWAVENLVQQAPRPKPAIC